MNLGRQWNLRLEMWNEEIKRYYAKEAASLEVEYFTTMDQLSFDTAKIKVYEPVKTGKKWGRKWEYGWFHTSYTVPQELEGQRLILHLGVGAEMLIWINGVESGSIDMEHSYVTLSRCAAAGESFDIYAECYAGHGPRLENGGHYDREMIPVPEPPEFQAEIKESKVFIWNEAVYQAGMDYFTLYQLLQVLPEKSLRAMKVAEGLKKFTYIADFELDESERTESIIEADKILKPLLACVNGSTVPEYTAFGQSHLDLAWLWPVEETKRKTARTYSNQLALMEEYPNYKFLMCEPPIGEWLKKYYPKLYKRVLDKVQEGQMVPEGAMWIEADTNIPSGESLIRQFAWGKRWFREELGVDSRLAWMPDTFGYSAALPQIMKKCQVDYFTTQKLLRADPESQTFPYTNFWWEGMDGTRILSNIHMKNNSVFTPYELVKRWEDDRKQQENVDGLLFPFGYGDGGGGPTRDMLEVLSRCENLEGLPKCKVESPTAYFDKLSQEEVENVYCGELYLAWHRGTYTSQSETKRGIRKAELALHEVEFWMSILLIQKGSIPQEMKDKLKDLWTVLLLNQFHDIAPGTSIHRVHEEAVEQLDAVIQQGNSLCREIIRLLPEVLPDENRSSVVFNTLSWDRKIGERKVPACGYTVFTGETAKKTVCRKENKEYVLSNEGFSVTIDETGRITSLIGKAGREFLAAPGNELEMYKDVNIGYDAWEIGSMYEKVPVVLEDKADITIQNTDTGDIVHIERKIHDSFLKQDIILHDSGRVDFVTELDWRERHKLLKAAFPVAVFAKEAYHETQFGYVKRPTHRSRQSDRDQYEVTNQKYSALADGTHGVAVLNDCKYGINVRDHIMKLTLMRAPVLPDMYADLGVHSFIYSVYPFEGCFTESDVVRESYELNNPLTVENGTSVKESVSYFQINKKNIILETVKPADVHEHAILLRLYEAAGMHTETKVKLGFKPSEVLLTDMLEEQPAEAETAEDGILLEFTPFEIKTIIIKM